MTESEPDAEETTQEEAQIGELSAQLEAMQGSSDRKEPADGTVEDNDEDTTNEPPEESEQVPNTSSTTESEDSRETDGNNVAPDTATADASLMADSAAESDTKAEFDPTEPAFAFSAEMQRGVFPRDEAWGDWDDVKYAIEGVARTFDVKNLKGREIDDALFRYLARHSDEVAKEVAILALQERGLNVALDDI